MSSDKSVNLSSQELGERFDLLASDAKEYAVFLVGSDGRVLCWNAGAQRLFGYRSHEVIGTHFSRFFSPEDLVTSLPEHELHSASENGRNDATTPGEAAFMKPSTARAPDIAARKLSMSFLRASRSFGSIGPMQHRRRNGS